MSHSIKETEELNSEGKFTCKNCNSIEYGKLYYNLALLCRENAFSNKIITLYLSTYDEQGNGFFGVAPTDLFRNSSEYQRLKEIVRRLTEPECYISVLVEAIRTGISDTDRIYRIIGEYQNNLV